MVKKEALHLLIRSLTKSEKRYFRLFCQREASGKNYLRLFDAIEKQEVYDEAAIKKLFAGEVFVKQLHVTKHYLKKLILKSLRNFHAEISKDALLKDMLRNVEILFKKELYQLCETELKKSEELATRYELVGGAVEITGWRRKLEQARKPGNYPVFRSIVAEQGEAIRKLQNLNDYWKVAIDVSSSMFANASASRGDTALLNQVSNALTLEAKVLHYNTSYLKFLQENREEEAEQALQVLIALHEQYPERILEEPGLYVSGINNLVSFLLFKKRNEDALKLIARAKSAYEGWDLTSESKTLVKQMLRTYNIELEIYRSTKTFHTQAGFIESTERFVTNNGHRMPAEYLVSFWFQLANIHFMMKNFSRSLHWVNQLLNARLKGERVDLQAQAHFLNLMVHLEQQNLFVLRYFVDSARRFLKKSKEVQPFEEVLLKFFVKMGKLELLEYKNAFRELQSQLFPAGEPSLVPVEILGYIDYREWLASKI